MSFHAAWAISALIILSLAWWAGRATTKQLVGILFDERGRFSLNHLQLVMWTVLGLSSLMGLLLARLSAGEADLLRFTIPQELLVLMGISVGSATIAGAAKSAKDASSTAKIGRLGATFTAGTSTRTIGRHFAQVFQQEEGEQADQVVDITKFQNFVFTIMTGVAFVVLVWNQATLDGLPPLPDQMLWLLGISHAGYVGGKLPTRP